LKGIHESFAKKNLSFIKDSLIGYMETSPHILELRYPVSSQCPNPFYPGVIDRPYRSQYLPYLPEVRNLK